MGYTPRALRDGGWLSPRNFTDAATERCVNSRRKKAAIRAFQEKKLWQDPLEH